MRFILSVLGFLIAVVVVATMWYGIYSLIPRTEYENAWKIGTYFLILPFGGFALIVGQALSTLFVAVYERIFGNNS